MPALPGRVQVAMPACDAAPVDPASLLWALRVELAVDGVSSVEFAPPGSHPGDEGPLATITLKAPCDPAALELTIEIDDVATSKTLERRVSVADVPPSARARAVAIGAAELLRASWAELALAEHPAAAVPAQTDFLRRAVALHLTGPKAESMMQPDGLVTVVLDGRLFPNYSSGLVGPRAELSIRLTRALPLRVRADVGAAFGTAHDPIGDIDLVLVSGALGLAASSEVGPLRAEVGPRFEMGWAHARGVPFDTTVLGSSASGATIAGLLDAQMWFRVASRAWLSTGVAAGDTFLGLDARADGRRAAGIGGPTMGVRVGAGMSW
jgi:hypothetical protein